MTSVICKNLYRRTPITKIADVKFKLFLKKHPNTSQSPCEKKRKKTPLNKTMKKTSAWMESITGKDDRKRKTKRKLYI